MFEVFFLIGWRHFHRNGEGSISKLLRPNIPTALAKPCAFLRNVRESSDDDVCSHPPRGQRIIDPWPFGALVCACANHPAADPVLFVYKREKTKQTSIDPIRCLLTRTSTEHPSLVILCIRAKFDFLLFVYDVLWLQQDRCLDFPRHVICSLSFFFISLFSKGYRTAARWQ